MLLTMRIKTLFNMKEIWRNIEGYRNLYKVSNYGRVKSLGNKKNRKEKIISLLKTEKGYLVAPLSKNGKSKRFKVHRLVAIHFIPNPENKPEVNHIEGIKDDNRSWMLEWCTEEENEIHAKKLGLFMTNAKLTAEQVLEIKSSKEKAKTICIKYNVSLGIIYNVRKGLTYRSYDNQFKGVQ